MSYYLVFISLIITIGAEVFVKYIYSKYSKDLCNSKLTGFEVADKILKKEDIDNIYVVETNGFLSDHFDPINNVVRLSRSNFHGDSISSVAVSAHEIGHVIQHKENNILIKIRSAIVPFVNFCSRLSYFVIIIGLFLGYYRLFYLGALIMLGILLFQLITLPVEIDASKKAIKYLEDLKILDKEELSKGKLVLVAAALTYVAGLANTVIQILRLLYLGNERD